MEEPSMEYDRGFIDGTKEGKRQLKERIKELEALMEQLVLIAEKADTDDSEDTTIELAKQKLKG